MVFKDEDLQHSASIRYLTPISRDTPLDIAIFVPTLLLLPFFFQLPPF